MTAYQRIILATNEPDGAPGPLPSELYGLDDISLVDLSWTPPSMGYDGIGYWPTDVLEPAVPEVRAADLVLISIDVEAKRCVAEYAFLPLPDFKAVLTGMIRNLRWFREQAGFEGADGHVATDAETQGRLTNTVTYMDKGAVASVDWERAPGVFAALSAQDVADLAVAVGAHVQACFTQSRVLTEAVQVATTPEALSAIDIHAGWPP
jgi:hypothetical protein